MGEWERAHLVVQLRLFFYIYIYIRVVRRALNVLRVSFSPIFQYLSAVNVCIYVYTHAMRHGIVLSAMDSSTLSPMDSSAMDSSAIGVGVDVLVGKFMQGPWSAVPDIRSIRWYGNFPNSWLLFTN